MFPYGDGTQLYGGPGNLNPGRVAHLAGLARPADTICFFDSRWVGTGYSYNWVPINLGIAAKSRHANTVNIVFADSHVKAITGTPYSGTNYNPPLAAQERVAAQNGAINLRVLLDKSKYVWDPADPASQ